MVSVCCEIGLLCITAMLMYGLKLMVWSKETGEILITKDEKNRKEENNGKESVRPGNSIASPFSYHPLETGILYFFVRIFPVLMLEEKSRLNAIGLLWDIPIVVLLLIMTMKYKYGRQFFLTFFTGYLILPVSTYCIQFSGRRNWIVLTAFIFLYGICLLMGNRKYRKRKENNQTPFLSYYKFYWPAMLLITGLFFLLISLDLKEAAKPVEASDAEKLEEIVNAAGNNLWVAAGCAAAAVILAFVFIIKSNLKTKIFISSENQEAGKAKRESIPKDKQKSNDKKKSNDEQISKDKQISEGKQKSNDKSDKHCGKEADKVHDATHRLKTNGRQETENNKNRKQKAIRKNRKADDRTFQKAESVYHLTRPVSYTKWDYIALFIIGIVSVWLIFWQLGSKEAPQTTRYMNLQEPGANELVIDLGENRQLSSLQIFLGRIDNRKLSISAYDETIGEWNLLYENMNVSSVFCWNELQIPMTTRHLGIVAMDAEAYLNELVILDANGQTIVPVNADKYPELFDEQELYPLDKTYYVQTMFDEIYHARTAYEIIEGTSIYEYTHPHLGKILMGIGIRLFGMTPYGWRFVCAVFGSLLMLLSYLMVRRISGKTWIAVIADSLFLFDFMHYTLSRIGTIDIIIAFFLLAMFYSMYAVLAKVEENAPEMERLLATEEKTAEQKEKVKKLMRQEGWRILVSGFVTALAIATKWTGLYAAAGLAVMIVIYLSWHYKTWETWKQNRRHLLFLFLSCVVSFIMIPLLIYCLSFWPYLKLEEGKNLIQIAWEQSNNMFHYHKGITETHPYMSEWYEWLWDKRPLLDAFEGLSGREVYTISSVATFGNPLVWFIGSVALLYNVYLWRVKKDRTAELLVIAYLSMLLPWLLVHRTVFIYQYFGCVLVMPALIANAMRTLDRGTVKCQRRLRWTGILLTVLAGLLFIVFFPEISGMECTSAYANDVLEWLPSWVFA